MTTREEAIHACLIDSSVYPDTPFHDANWTIIRHQENQKCLLLFTSGRDKLG